MKVRAALGAALVAATSIPAQWSAITGVSPPPRAGHAMAADTSGNTIVFGGEAPLLAPFTNDTWRFDGSTWQQLAPATSPPPRVGASFVFDSARSRFVMFGGVENALWYATSQTWEFDGANWTQVATPTTPNAVSQHAVCFDSARNRTVVYGGSLYPAAFFSGDTYEYDGTTWQLTVLMGSPGPLADAAMCFHAGLGKAVLFGGSGMPGVTTDATWLYDGVQWTPAPVAGNRPSPRSGARMTYDAARGVCVLFGGNDPMANMWFGDTWEFDGTSWQQQPGGPQWATDAGLAWDVGHGNVVLFGGFGYQYGSLLGNTWLYGAYTHPFGTGCAGSAGVPLLQATTPPNLGLTYHLQLSNLPPASPIAVLALGLTAPPPVSLASIGMPGCAAFVQPDVLITLAAAGTAGWAAGLPGSPTLLGVSVYAQGIGLDPGVNAAGLTTSNAVAGLLGH